MSPNFEIHRYLPGNRGANLVPECWYQNPVGRGLVPDQHSHDHEYRIRCKGYQNQVQDLVPGICNVECVGTRCNVELLVLDAMLWYQNSGWYQNIVERNRYQNRFWYQIVGI
jgi:hypothetical protein